MSSLVAAMENSHITAPRSAHSKESSDSIFPFTKLPPEIRNKIYRYVLSTEHTKYNRLQGLNSHYYRFGVQILRTNRQIYREASQIFHHRNLFVIFKSDWLRTTERVKECGIQICDEDRAVRKFAGHTTMVERIVPKSELSQVRFYILPADDLPLVCTNLLRLDKGKNATAHGISLAIHVNDYQVDEDQDNTDSNGMPTVQSNTSRLLDPFRSLYGISSVQITGLVSDEYKSAVIADITKARPTPEQHVSQLISVLHTAEAARKASSSLEAISYYNALEERILRFRLSALIPEGAHTLTSGEYAGSLLCDVTVDITFRKNHGSAISYMQLKDYAEARKYLQTALVPLYERDEGEGIPIKPAVLTELAMMNARAGRAVGLPRTTTRELEAYLRYKPDDSIVRAELGRLKEELAGQELAREEVAKQKLAKLKLVEEELAKLLADEDLVDQELVNRAVDEQELILLEYAMLEELSD